MNNEKKKRFPKKPPRFALWAKMRNDSTLASRIAAQQLRYYNRSLLFKRSLFRRSNCCSSILGTSSFFVTSAPSIAIALSVLVVLSTSIDSVFTPYQKWKHFSRVADLLFLWEAKRQSDFDDYKDAVEILLDAEQHSIGDLSICPKQLAQHPNRSNPEGPPSIERAISCHPELSIDLLPRRNCGI